MLTSTAFARLSLPFVLTFSSLSYATPVPSEAPLNPQFSASTRVQMRVQTAPVTTHQTGYRPAPVSIPATPKTDRVMIQASAYPASYDLRWFGKVTGVRDQGSCNNCWTYGAFGSLESALLRSENRNFSESHLNDTHGFDYSWCQGGNEKMATAYLARWSGAGYDPDYPLPVNNNTSAIPVRKHIQNMDLLAARNNSLDNDAIKKALIERGAVTVSYTADAQHYNPTTSAWYNPTATITDHAVTVVGWNDNYPKTNFSTQPAGNGAFIVKNSWGSSWGKNGYFYLSYYDASLTPNAAFHQAEPTNNYSKMYSYDPLGWTGNVGYNSNTAWMANVFNTGNSNQTLRAVSFYTPSANSSYEIKIFKGLTSSNPNSGTEVLSTRTNGTRPNAGYHTIHLNAPTVVSANTNFSVVIKLITPNVNYPIPMERSISNYSSAATANAGESFISFDGNNWNDLTQYYPNTNVCIKAFAGTKGTIPHPFAFADKTNVAHNTLIESNTVTLSGLTADAAISITGGEYQINNGAYTTTAGTVPNGATVRLRQLSANTARTAQHTIVTIGGLTDTFSTYTQP